MNYKILGNLEAEIDKEALIRKIYKYINYSTSRQDRFKEVHGETKAIVLVDKIFGNDTPELLKHFDDDLQILYKELNRCLRFEYFDAYSVIFALMPPKSKIAIHKDNHLYFDTSHRSHIVLATNKDVVFDMDGEVIPPVEGSIFEINGTKIDHSVANNGNEDRIHLVISCYDNDERKETIIKD